MPEPSFLDKLIAAARAHNPMLPAKVTNSADAAGQSFKAAHPEVAAQAQKVAAAIEAMKAKQSPMGDQTITQYLPPTYAGPLRDGIQLMHDKMQPVLERSVFEPARRADALRNAPVDAGEIDDEDLKKSKK